MTFTGVDTPDLDSPFDVEEHAAAMLRLRDGAVIYWERGWATHLPEEHRWEVYGTRAGLSFVPHSDVLLLDMNLTLTRYGPGQAVDLPLPPLAPPGPSVSAGIWSKKTIQRKSPIKVGASADSPDEVRKRSREQLMFGASQLKLAAGGGVVSSEELLERVWDENADPFTTTVRVTVMTLRKKLGDPGIIETVVGSGYRVPTADLASG